MKSAFGSSRSCRATRAMSVEGAKPTSRSFGRRSENDPQQTCGAHRLMPATLKGPPAKVCFDSKPALPEASNCSFVVEQSYDKVAGYPGKMWEPTCDGGSS